MRHDPLTEQDLPMGHDLTEHDPLPLPQHRVQLMERGRKRTGPRQPLPLTVSNSSKRSCRRVSGRRPTSLIPLPGSNGARSAPNQIGSLASRRRQPVAVPAERQDRASSTIPASKRCRPSSPDASSGSKSRTTTRMRKPLRRTTQTRRNRRPSATGAYAPPEHGRRTSPAQRRFPCRPALQRGATDEVRPAADHTGNARSAM